MPNHTQPKHRLSGEERKADIVATAVKLFSEKGFRGTTTRELAAACGVSEPVLYSHFATKDELYRAMIERICCADQRQKDTELEEARAAQNDLAYFRRLAEVMLERFEAEPELVRLLLFSALEGHDLARLFYERRVVIYFQMITDYINDRMRVGAFREMDPYLAARVFTGAVRDLGVTAAVFSPRDVKGTRKEIAEGLVGIFLDGIRNTSSST